MLQPVFDALLIVSFGGPEQPDEVMPFLRRVVAGRGVPDERLAAVAAHYQHFGGASPLPAQVRALKAALEPLLDGVPVYIGHRNGPPFLEDTVRRLRDDGVRSAAAFVTSAFGSPPGCRRYQDDIDRALAAVPGAPTIHKLPLLHDRRGFLQAQADRIAEVLPAGGARLLFTAHSIPTAMAATSPYEGQLRAAAAWLAERFGLPWELVWQSRSGPPRVPWLEPDVCDRLRQLSDSEQPVVLVPLGFLSDHMEVRYDLDVEARDVAREVGITLLRAGTVGTHPRFVELIRDLLLEAAGQGTAERVPGLAPWDCPTDCCPAVRPGRR
jgi:ferrochelatase